MGIESLSTIDYALVAFYAVAVLYCGMFVGRGGDNTLKDYAIGSRDFSTMAIISTVCSTVFGATALNGTLMIGYLYGLKVFVYHELLEIFGNFMTFYIAANYIQRFYGMISIGDVMGAMYGRAAKMISGLVAIILCYLGVTAQVIAMGLVIEYFLGFSLTTSLVLSSTVTVLYTSIGGVRGVMWTDVIQFSLIAVSIPLIFNLLISCIGGYSEFFSLVPASHYDLDICDPISKKWLYFGLVDALPAIYPVILQRVLMTSSQKQVREVLMRIVPMTFIASLLMILMGMAFFVFKYKYSVDVEPRLLLNYFIDQYIPSFFKGVAVVGIMSVLMSTQDSFLNTMGVTLVNDVIKPVFAGLSDSMALRVAKILTVVIGITSVFMALSKDSIVYLRVASTGLWSSTVMVPLLLGILGFRTKPVVFYVSLVFGIGTSISMRVFCDLQDDMMTMLPSMVASTFGFFLGQAYLKLSGVRRMYTMSDDTSKRKMLHDLIYKVNKNRRRARVLSLLKDVVSFNLVKYLRDNVHENGAEDILLSSFLVLINIFPLFMCYGPMSGNPKLLALKYSSALLSLAVILRHKMPAWYQKRWELFWHLSLVFCLPFSVTAMLIVNGGELYWHISMMIAIFIVSVSVSREMFFIDMAVGIFAAHMVCCRMFGYQVNFFHPTLDKYSLIYGYAFFIIIGVLFSKRKQLRDAERTDAYLKASSIISHEISSPLGIISCSIERLDKLVKKFDMQPEDKEECDSAVEAAKVTLNNIDNFMTLFLQNIKNAEEFAAFDLSPVNLKTVIDDIMKYYPLHERKREIIKIDYTDCFEVWGNEILIRQSLLNVLRNSLFFISGVAGAEIRVTFKAPRNGQYNVLSVIDTGIGIPEEVREKIFRKFYTQRDGGSGLGLFFCANSMQRMGGVIECNSKVGEFTEMLFKFPKMNPKPHKLSKVVAI